MEQSNPASAFAAFESAIAHNPKDPDIYYHRGQGVLPVVFRRHIWLMAMFLVYFIMGQFADAAENYSKSMALDNTFVFSHIQLAVAQYKSEKISSSMATFRRTMKMFPQRSEPQNY